jgi:hypothetical protein
MGILDDSPSSAIQNMPLVAFFDEYICRHNYLQDVCLYEVEARYQFVSEFPENFTDRHYTCISHLGIPQSGSVFCHKERSERFIPSFPGFNTKSKTHGVGTEAFARIMLILFKPFRDVTDLISTPFLNFRMAFAVFLRTMEDENPHKRIIRNFIKDAEVALEAANYDHPENPLQPNQFYQTSSRGTIEWNVVRYHLSDPDGDLLPSLDSINEPAVTNEKTQSIFLQQVDLDLIRSPSNRVVTEQSRDFVPSMNRIHMIALISGFLQNRLTSRACSIQRAAVKIFAKHVLDSVCGEEVPPLRMLIHGEGGTGKSFVINCMVELMDYLGRRNMICVCAPTGKAAVNVGGDTIDGLFGLSRAGSGTGHGNTANTTETSLPTTSPLTKAMYLIVDEISMVGKERLCDMHDKLGVNLGDSLQSNHLLGNKSFIFFGDFLQFPPVGKTCIISKSTFPVDANGERQYFSESRKRQIGTLIFRSIDYMLELTEQKRQDDLEYLNFLRDVRDMKVNETHLEYLKKNCCIESINNYPSNWLTTTPFVVSTNDEKQYWNAILVQKYSEVTSKNVIIIDAVDWIQKEISNANSNTHLNMIDLHNLKQKIIDGCLQYQLRLVVGMDLVVLENLHKHLGVVNGAEVTLQKIHLDQFGAAIALEVFVKNQSFSIEGLPPNTIWILRKKASESFRKMDGTNVQIQRHQFPVTEGFASTAHKKQGSTLSRAILCLEKGQGVASYVKLSRTKRASDTFIIGSLNLKSLQIKPPSGWQLFRKYLQEKAKFTLQTASRIDTFQSH